MKFKSFLGLIIIGTLLLGCAHSRAKKYEGLIEPRVGKAKQTEINALLGNPVFCRQENRYEMCEYRTATAHNLPIPDMFRKSEGLTPDLSPYEYFDVLHLYFDSFQVLKEWEIFVLSR